MLSYLFIVVITFNQPLCSQSKGSTREAWLTVFVHGIIGVDAKTCFANAFQFLTDQLKHTLYAKSVEYMRSDEFFTRNQAMQSIGLHPIKMDNFEKGYASGAVARTYDHVLSLCPCKQDTYYYTYGWSGLLSFKARYEDAQNFYKALIELRSHMKKQDIEPKIRLIGYSHGANVCLNLVQVAKEETFASIPLEIDELILLGAPIQRETEKLIDSPLFKKIYSFYSRSDCVQKKDLFSSQQFFSKRVFCNRHEFELPATLTQIEIKILTEYKPRKKKAQTTQQDMIREQKATDLTKNSIIKGHSWWLKNMSPGHTELWFMEWTPQNYRRTFPLYPVPIVTITPYLIQLIETTSPKQTTSRHLVVDIRPDHNYMVIRHRYPQRRFTTVSFLSQETFKRMDTLSKPNKPDNYTQPIYNKHKETARLNAYNDRKELIRARRARRRKTI